MIKIANAWGNDELWNENFDYVYKITLKNLLRDDCNKFIQDYEYKGHRLKALAAYNLESRDEDKAN